MPGKPKALVADDIEGNRKLIKSFLFFSGFDADTAADGLEAARLLEAGSYALLVTDIEMPNMNGFELLGAVRRKKGLEKLPVIMLSTLDTADVKDRCKRLGASAYVVKPFTREKMHEALAACGLAKAEP